MTKWTCAFEGQCALFVEVSESTAHLEVDAALEEVVVAAGDAEVEVAGRTTVKSSKTVR